MLYNKQKEPGKREKVRKLIRESIDNFHCTLIEESKISISLAVAGLLGVGKSFFLNFLLTWGLSSAEGPLPSAEGGSQTPIPIKVKYAENVQVLLHKKEAGAIPDVWFPEEELGNDTFARVNSVLTLNFQNIESLSDARCVELQGPFPIFSGLKEKKMTSSSQLELDIDVEFVDVPGFGDETADPLTSVELSNADVILFFKGGQGGRSVSSMDIARIFRWQEELKFTSRPKFVYIEKGGGSLREKKEDLRKAWSRFFSSSSDDKAMPSWYRDVRTKLPQLTGDALLEKLSYESDVICFHPEDGSDDVFMALKSVISDHFQSVKVKKTIHPFLLKVHWATKKLKTRIGQLITTQKRNPIANKREPVKDTIFVMLKYQNEASDLVTSFIEGANVPLQTDFQGLYHFLYDKFLHSSETLAFLWNMLKESMEAFTEELIANCCTMQEVSPDVKVLVEILCESRVQQFFAVSTAAYVRPFLEQGKNRNPLADKAKCWADASAQEKKELCSTFLDILLNQSERALEEESRTGHGKKSHFDLIKQLKEDVMDLAALGSLSNASSMPEILKKLHGKMQTIIKFCNSSIRSINPHPSLDVEANFTLPEPKDVKLAKEEEAPMSSHREIIEEMTKLLRRRPADAIHKLETKLRMNFGDLELRQPQGVDQQLWAKVLVNVLSDKDHFDIELEPGLVVDYGDSHVKRLLGLARERLFAHQRSFVTCTIINGQSLPENEIHLKKSCQEKYCLEVLISSEMSKKLDSIREEFQDLSKRLAPIFIPTIRPGPTQDIQGNYFLEEDPWSKFEVTDDRLEEDGGRVHKEVEDGSVKNIFLVVEPKHLRTIRTTIDGLLHPGASKDKLAYVVLPQNGRGIGVTRAIIKSLAECLNFSFYWTIDDDIQFMYQFDGNARRWHKCSLIRGLLFGQRVFQSFLEKASKPISDKGRYDLFYAITDHWPPYANQIKREALTRLVDSKYFAEVQKNPSLLHSPFAKISEDCGGDAGKEEVLQACVQDFVKKCRERLFEDSINRIGGISLAHESTKRYDYVSKYPTADCMRSNQRYQVVLNNTHALKGMNFVTDEVIFHAEEYQIDDSIKRNTPYWGIRGEDKSFCRALDVSGVIGYQVIRIVHSHKRLRNVFDRIGPSYIRSPSPDRPGCDDDDGMDCN